LRAGAVFFDALRPLLLFLFAFFAMVFLLLALRSGASFDLGYSCRSGRSRTLPHIAAIRW
jgi:hypothetical protein